jgi:hypothetical protein
MLPSMAAGLGSILFAITIDNALLNTATDPFAKSELDEMSILASVKKSATSADANCDDVSPADRGVAATKKKKKSRKISAQIVEFDETDVGKMRQLREASASRDRFYEAPFLPKTFRMNFRPSTFGQISTQKQQIFVYLSRMDNNILFQHIIKLKLKLNLTK